MPLLDTLQDGIARFMPSKHDSIPKPMSGGISGGGHGMVPFDDDVSSFFQGCRGFGYRTNLRNTCSVVS